MATDKANNIFSQENADFLFLSSQIIAGGSRLAHQFNSIQFNFIC